MLKVNPFAALRPRSDAASRVASVPYDVVNTKEARELAKDNDASFLHVVRPEIDLPEGTDPYAAVVYDTAKKNLDRLVRDGILVREAEPSIYLYRQQMTLLERRVSQTGIVCCTHIDDYNRGIIKKHEKTRQDKEDDRTRHVLTLQANAGPVFLMYRDDSESTALMRADQEAPPLFDFEAPDGVHHTVWRVSDAARYVAAFERVPAAYVADGHHRSASAARAGAELRQKNPAHTGNEEYNWFLSVLFPASELTILPYHRLVKDLAGQTPDAVLEAIRKVARVEPTSEPQPPSTLSFGMYLEKKWYRVTLDPTSVTTTDPVSSLDYVLLSERILGPVLKITDLRTDKRIDFVGGIRGTAELERRVDSGECAIAFAMHRTTIEQLLAVADAGAIMPPKSTWFEPKLRSGLLVHTID
jgi:uncharacterized protein (DUF1015 family)